LVNNDRSQFFCYSLRRQDGAIDQILFGEVNKSASFPKRLAFQSSSGAEGPTTATLINALHNFIKEVCKEVLETYCALIFDGSDVSFVAPVNSLIVFCDVFSKYKFGF
jgi:hypothetical protein